MTMTPADWQRIEAIYHAALARPVAERAAFLIEACAGDQSLRRDVDSLLAAGAAAESLLKTGGAWPRTTLIGQRLGVYQIVSLLGAGGMGEVYRARDTKLDRDVAIKVLPPAFANDPDRLARFSREAKTLAALNHPNIAAIYGIEGTALVMELVEGDDLSAIIAGGPQGPPRRTNGMPLAEVLAVAKQIADALEAAHELGIVHRDLKPANIKVRADGTVKVLDFGLAKAMKPASASDAAVALANSPTITTPAPTEQGFILGTAAYMSPEQAAGKAADKRSDLWSFGVVLFEMLTGRRLFAGETVTHVLAEVLKSEPDWTRLPTGTPPQIHRLLRRCLDKDRRRRLDSAAAARLDIEEAIAAPALAVPPRARGLVQLVPWALTALVIVIAVASGARPATQRAPQFTQVTEASGEETAPNLSPDGTTVVYSIRVNASWDIVAQRVGGRTMIPIAADLDRDESAPAFSPNGLMIAFHVAGDPGGIFVVGATGESARRLTPFGYHPAWSPDGAEIVFTSAEITNPYTRGAQGRLWIVSASGGVPTRLETGDDAVHPAWSPSGHTIAYWGVPSKGQRDIYTVPARGGDRVAVTDDAAVDWAPVWAPDGAAGVRHGWRPGLGRPAERVARRTPDRVPFLYPRDQSGDAAVRRSDRAPRRCGHRRSLEQHPHPDRSVSRRDAIEPLQFRRTSGGCAGQRTRWVCRATADQRHCA